MPKKREPIEVEDTTFLTDADWSEINKLRDIYESGGQKALSAAIDELTKRDPVRAIHND